MKILIEVDVRIDTQFGSDSDVIDVPSQLISHLEQYVTEERDDIVGDFNTILVPSNMCWDCYNYITIESFKLIQ